MKSSTIAAFITAAVLLLHSRSEAQTFALPFSLSQSSPALTFSIDANGTLKESGPTNTSLSFSLTTGSQMLWIPALSAFRAGIFSSLYSNNSTIGQYSAAFGYYTSATGFSSFASGDGSLASGNYSTAIGASQATGFMSTAVGTSTASGSNSFAAGEGTSTGNYATALGLGFANGGAATAMGYATVTSGSLDSFAVGTCNVGGGSSTTWVATDPLFEIGNGSIAFSGPPWEQTSTITGSDAFVVYKNGNATVQGTLGAHSGLRCPAGGDLSMGSFTAGTAP
jgi:hypothetical protein